LSVRSRYRSELQELVEFDITVSPASPVIGTPGSPEIVETVVAQPKIRELQDNFGHTFRPTRGAVDGVQVEDKVVLTTETTVKLCITKIAAPADARLTHSCVFLE